MKRNIKSFIKCPECGNVDLGNWDGGQYYQCSKCKKIQHNFPEPLKAISIRQPWAWLIVNGYKPLENRSTLKNFRGDVLIHASNQFDRHGFNWIYLQYRAGDLPVIKGSEYLKMAKSDFDTGGIVGVATFTGSVTESDSPWFAGPNAFTIENARPLPFTPCKGALGFFYPKIN